MGPQITKEEYKKFNKAWTTRELPRVVGCDHKVDPDIPPRTNCDNCWFHYLNQDKDMILEIHGHYKAGKKKELIAVYGTTFVKQIERFMATVVKMRKENGELNE